MFLNSSADEPLLTEPKDACYLSLGLGNVGATILVKYDAQMAQSVKFLLYNRKYMTLNYQHSCYKKLGGCGT